MSEIAFLCAPDRAPLEAEQLCRSLGIKITRRSLEMQDDDMRLVTFHVPTRQRRWAASLIAGDGFAVLEPRNIKPVRPRTRWGKERRSYGPQSIVVYILEALFGTQRQAVPVRQRGRSKQRKRAGAQHGGHTELIVQKPYCAPARDKILTALQPRGVIVGIDDITEQTVNTSVKTLLQRMRIEARTFENLKYAGVGLPVFLPIATEATIRVRSSQAKYAEYLLASSGQFTIERGIDKKSRRAGYRRNGSMPPAWNARKTQTYIRQKLGDTPMIEQSCNDGKHDWRQFLDAVEQAKKGKQQR